MSNDCFIGVDVGTGSVRAGLVSHDGRVLKTQSEDLEVGQTDEMSAFYEPPTGGIHWKPLSTCRSVPTPKHVLSNKMY